MVERVQAHQWKVALPALLKHYKIEAGEEQWFWLAMELARDHVPAFRLPQPSGRKHAAKTTVADFFILIELHRAEADGRSVANTARHLSKAAHLPDVRDRSVLSSAPNPLKGMKPDYLRQRYYRLLDDRTPEGSHIREMHAALKEPATVPKLRVATRNGEKL
jgi:hypothetical protein